MNGAVKLGSALRAAASIVAAALLVTHCGSEPIIRTSTSRCSPPALECNGRCTDIASDPANCGGCNMPCGAGDECVAGTCQRTGCPAGRTDCGGLCVDLASNPLNCGSCNRACAAVEVCVNGACECSAPAVVCDGVCTDLTSSAQHCGACGRACAIDEECRAGNCEPRCVAPLSFCTDRCVDLESDATACGSCQTPCTGAEVCELGQCRCPSDSYHATCDNVCVDLRVHAEHCGGCENACSAAMHCESGLCTSCRTGFFYCPSQDGDPLATCLAQARDWLAGDAGASTSPDAATDSSTALFPDLECQCNHCLVELNDCVQDEGCVRGWQCALTNACTAPCWEAMAVCSLAVDPNSCWKWCPPSTGGTQSAARAEALMTCTRANGCGM